MNENIKISVIGGDARLLVVAKELHEAGFGISMFAAPEGGYAAGVARASSLAECTENTQAVILGVPFSPDGKWISCQCADCAVSLRSLYELLAPRALLLGGRVTPEAHTAAARYGVRFLDYLDREEVNIHNAVPTAEGAIAIAMNELPVTLNGSRAAVLGYGRVARALAPRLAALGARVTVAARRARDIAWCAVAGYDTVTFDSLGSLAGTDVIFNTVPVTVLGKAELASIGPGTLLVDLASKPGGIDMEAAGELCMRVVWALSLPGKVAPVTAGRIITDSVTTILREEGVL